MSNKVANLIIVGGTIAAGKSCLVEGLAKAKNFIPIPELNAKDAVQNIILEKLYEGKRIHNATIQFYFVTHRLKQYENEFNGSNTSILDRGIWEDWFFAKLLMSKNEPKSYNYFKDFWRRTIEYKIKKYGKPKAYIFTKVNWETFKERIFKRGRKVEINNFDQNKEYFKKLLNEYNKNFISLLQEWDINPIVVETNDLNKKEVLKVVLKELEKRNI